MTKIATRSMIAAALSLAVLATPASAEDVTVRIKYEDLNLGHAAGIRQLEVRIDAAVDKVCGRTHYTTMSTDDDVRRCRSEVRQQAISQVAALSGQPLYVAVRSDTHRGG